VAEKARRVYCLAYVSIITENNTRLDFPSSCLHQTDGRWKDGDEEGIVMMAMAQEPNEQRLTLLDMM
jgi:hypothetical protein